MDENKNRNNKKMKFINLKKLIPVLMAFALIVSPFMGIGKAFAYSGGLLDGKTLYWGTGISSTASTNTTATDDNTNTTVSLFRPNSGNNNVLWYSFSTPQTINSYYYKGSVSNLIVIRFYNSSGTQIGSDIPINLENVNTFSSVSNVSKVALVNTDVNTTQTVSEFDVMGPAPVTHTEITGLTTSVSGQNVTLNYSVPSSNTHFTGSKIYRDGSLIATQGKTTTSYVDKNLAWNSNHTYKVTATYDDGFETTGATTTANINVKHDEITNLTSSNNKNVVTLNFSIPSTNTAYNGSNVYRNGVLIGSLGTAATSFIDSSAPYDTDLSYKVTALYLDGYETTGATVSMNIPSPKPVADVTGLAATTKDKEVDLSFVPPNTDKLQTINIYRDGNLIGTTTGSSFIDKNVGYSTSYNYTVKTVSVDNVESSGVSVKVTSKAETPPTFEGAFTQGQNGNYTITWTQPTTGNVKIIMAGQTLDTVPASGGSYTIPKANMKYTPLGDPDISVQPISESGMTGNSVSWPKQNIKPPFSVTDLIQSGNGLLWLISPFVLLALTFLLVPKLRRLLFSTLKNIRGRKEEIPGRRTKDESKENEGTKEQEAREAKPGIDDKEQRNRTERELRTEREAAVRTERSPRQLRESRMNRIRVSRVQKERNEREPRRTREPREQRAPRIPRGRRGN